MGGPGQTCGVPALKGVSGREGGGEEGRGFDPESDLRNQLDVTAGA